jgi:hypothetical protein
MEQALIFIIIILDKAFVTAQAIGMNPSLCAPGSAFLSYYQACMECVNAYSKGDGGVTVNSLFLEFISYCNSTSASPIPSTTASPSPSFSTTPAQVTHTTTLPEAFDIVVTITYTATDNGLSTIFTLEKTLTSFAPPPSITIITISTTEDGHPTLWEFTKTYIPLSADLSTTNLQNTPTSAHNTTSGEIYIYIT